MDLASYRNNLAQQNDGVDPYADLTDQQFAARLHERHYSDIPFEAFASKVGLQGDFRARGPTTRARTSPSLNIDGAPQRTQLAMDSALDEAAPEDAGPMERMGKEGGMPQIAGRADAKVAQRLPGNILASAGAQLRESAAGTGRLFSDINANMATAAEQSYRHPLVKPSGRPGGQARGLLEEGNINLSQRPQVRNADGSVSTVRSMSVGMDDAEVLIPTVSEDGRILSEQEAIDQYRKTGRHLGKFDSPENATRYAERLHESQAEASQFAAQQEQAAAGASERAGQAELTAGRMGRLQRHASEAGAAAVPTDAGPIERAVQSGLASTLVTAPIVTAGALIPGGQIPALVALGGQTGAQRYGELRNAGLSEGEAALSGAYLGGLEALTEKIPLGTLAKRSPFVQKMAEFMVTDVLGENISTAAQLADDYRLGLSDNVTVADIQQALKDTTAATIVGAGAQVSLHQMTESVLHRANEIAQQREPAIEQPNINVEPPVLQDEVAYSEEHPSEDITLEGGEPPQFDDQGIEEIALEGDGEMLPGEIRVDETPPEEVTLQTDPMEEFKRQDDELAADEELADVEIEEPDAGPPAAVIGSPGTEPEKPTMAQRRDLMKAKHHAIEVNVREETKPRDITYIQSDGYLQSERGLHGVAIGGQPVAWYQNEETARAEVRAFRKDVAERSLTKPAIAAAAHQAATSPQNELPEPTPAQIDAGNYKHGKLRLHGMDISIENPIGSVRRSKPDAPVKWQRTIKGGHYGYLRGSTAADGDHVDVFVGPHAASQKAFVIDQLTPDGKSYDEAKTVLAVNSEEEARKLYLSNYQRSWQGLGAITEMSIPEFKEWVNSPAATKPVAWTPSEAVADTRNISGVKAGSSQVTADVADTASGSAELPGKNSGIPADEEENQLEAILAEADAITNKVERLAGNLNLVGQWTHAKHDTSATVTKTAKGLKADFGGGDIQEFKGPTASAKLAAAMKKGGFSRAETEPMFHRAYHGSRHKFGKFKLDETTIGTGEGAQAYGWGLYFAEKPAVAEEYRRMTTDEPSIKNFRMGGVDVVRDGGYVSYSPRNSSAYEHAKARIIEDLLVEEAALRAIAGSASDVKAHVLSAIDDRIENFKEEWPEGVAGAEQLRREVEKYGIKIEMDAPEGAVYAVEIDDAAVANMLDWDKTFAQQPKAVKKALRDSGIYARFRMNLSDFSSKQATRGKGRGENFYEFLTELKGSQQAASKFLSEIGIHGIRYFDADSRDKKRGTRNIVVFDDSIIDITHVDGTPVTKDEKQSVVDPMFRRTEGKQAGKLAERDVRTEVNRLLREFKTRPRLTVVQSYDQLPKDLLAANAKRGIKAGEVRGIQWKGGIYFIADEFSDMETLRNSVLHETIIHFGLRSVIGQEAHEAILDGIARDQPMAVRRQGKTEFGDKFDWDNLAMRRIAAEEVLAYYAPQYLASKPVPSGMRKWVQDLIAKLEAFLRRVFDAPKDMKLPEKYSKDAMGRLVDDLQMFLTEGRTSDVMTDSQAMAERKLPSNNYRVDLSRYAPTIYRETNLEQAFQYIAEGMTSVDMSDSIHFAESPEMALGQGANKGVLMEFDSAGIEGSINLSKPMLGASFEMGDGEFVASLNRQSQYQKSLRAFTIKKDAEGPKWAHMRMRRTFAALEQNGWTKTQNEDGSVTYRRPLAAADLPMAERPEGMHRDLPPGPGANALLSDDKDFKQQLAKHRREHTEVGGGKYNYHLTNLSDRDVEIMRGVFETLDPAVAEQRRGARPWSTTEQASLDMLQTKFGLTLDSLVNRRLGSTANAETLEAYGRLVVGATKALSQLAEKASRTNANDDILALTIARERLGMMLAPAMGYRSEAGRSLNILRKTARDFQEADKLWEAMGDGSREAITDFAKRVKEVGTVDQIIGLVRASYTPTWWDKFYEYWINGILSGPKTHAVNIVSNAVMNALDFSAHAIAAATSKGVTLRELRARAAATVHGTMLGLSNAKRAFITEEPQGDAISKFEQAGNRRAIGGRLGKIVRIPGRALMAEDEFFKSVAYHQALAGLAMREAIATQPANQKAEFDRIMGDLLARRDLVEAARTAARQLTFQTPMGPITSAVARALDKTKVGRIIVPFIRTPTNILKAVAEYSPAAFMLERVQKAFKERADQPGEWAIAKARMSIGAGFALGAVGLAMQGLLSGAGPDDDRERKLLERTGWRPYSVKVGERWYRYNRFDPMGTTLGISADLYESSKYLAADEYDKAAVMLVTSIALNLGNKSYLSGIASFSEAYSDPQRYLKYWARDMATSLIPNVVGQAAREFDPFEREARGLIESAKSKIPGLRQQLPVRTDVAGEDIKATNFGWFVPLAVKDENSDPLAAAMLKLGLFKGPPERRIKNVELMPDEYRDFSQRVGQSLWLELTPMVQSDQFKAQMQNDPESARRVLEGRWNGIAARERAKWIQVNQSMIEKMNQQRGRARAIGSHYVDDLTSRVGPLLDGKTKKEAVQALRDSGYPALAALIEDIPNKPRQIVAKAIQESARV